MTEKLELEYNKLKKKYPNLPNFQVIDKEFEIEAHISDKIIPVNYTLRAVSNSITNYLYIFVDYLHNIIFPSTASLIIMEESKIFSESEKTQIENILKKLVWITRKNLELTVAKDGKGDSKFIIETYNEWKSLKKQLQPVLEKIKKHWGP